MTNDTATEKNLGHFNEMEKAGGQLAKAITDFDTAIFDMLQALGGQDIITEIQGILANWTGFWEEGALTVENILGSRWQAILGAFEDDVRAFVKNGADLEEEVQRLGAALTLQKFTDENPEVFAGRELAEILAVVEAFKAAGGTMEQALQRFVQTADAVISLTTALRDFAGSDLRTDFYNLINPLSLEQSLSVVRNALRDAVADFDGSIESLQTIGELSMVVRRGELELLQQIDAIQKGLNANLDKLKADILGIGAEPKSTEEIFQDAKRLIRDVRRATSAQDVARVGQEFEALIRQIPEADILAIGPALVASLVTQFQYAATRQLSAFKESTIGEGEELRATLDTFLAGIGDPLQIIADSLEGDSLPEVMDEGLSEINATVSTIGPQVASAIQQSLGNVNVTVVVQDAGLVTQ